MEISIVKNLANVLDAAKQTRPAAAQKFAQDFNSFISSSSDELKTDNNATIEQSEDTNDFTLSQETPQDKIDNIVNEDEIKKSDAGISDEQNSTEDYDLEVEQQEDTENSVIPQKNIEDALAALLEIINILQNTQNQINQPVNLEGDQQTQAEITQVITQLKKLGLNIDLDKIANLSAEQKTQLSNLITSALAKLQQLEQGVSTPENPQISPQAENSDDQQPADVDTIQQTAEPHNQKAIEVLTNLLADKIDNPKAREAIENILARFANRQVKQDSAQLPLQNSQNPQNNSAQIAAPAINNSVLPETAQNLIQNQENNAFQNKTEQQQIVPLMQGNVTEEEIAVQQDVKPKTNYNANANTAANQIQPQTQTDAAQKVDSQLFNQNADAALTDSNKKSGGNNFQADSGFEQLVINQTTTRGAGDADAPLPPIAKNQSSSSALADITKQINESIQNTIIAGQKSVIVKLNPAELGRVVIKFTEQGDQITGSMEVSKLQTKIDVQQALPNIIRNLADAGIQIKKLDVVLSNSDTFSQNQQKEYAANDSQSYRQNYQQNGYEDNSSFYSWLRGTKDVILSSYNNAGYQTSFSDRSVNLLA